MRVDKQLLGECIEQFAVEFDNMCANRMQMGAKKYGPGKFLTVDTMEEALFELADLSNYAKMTFIRVKLLQAQLQGMIDLGSQDFTQELG